MATPTRIRIDDVVLDAMPFEWPLYRGWEPRAVTIPSGDRRWQELDAAAKRANGVGTLHVSTWDGSLAIPIRITRILPREGRRLEIECCDTRIDLLRWHLPLDLNIAAGDQVVPDAAGNTDDSGAAAAVRQRMYLLGTGERDAVNSGPIKLYTAVRRICAITRTQYGQQASQIEVNFLGKNAAQIALDTVLPDQVRVSGLPMGRALQVACDPYGLSLVVSDRGHRFLADSSADDLDEQFARVEWAWERPTWESAIGRDYLRPKTFVVPFLKREEIVARTEDLTAATPAKVEYRLENVYRSPRLQYLTLGPYLRSLPADIAANALTEGIIARNRFSDVWQGTLLQSEASDPGPVAGLAESDRLPLVAGVRPEIIGRWRKSWRLKAVGPKALLLGHNGETIRGRGAWDDVRFGSIPTPVAGLPANINEVRNPIGDLDASLSGLAYEGGPSVRCAWVDVFAFGRAKTGTPEDAAWLRVMEYFRDNGDSNTPAPFACAWEEPDSDVFNLVPELAADVVDRIPGVMSQKGRVYLEGEADRPPHRMMGGPAMATPMSIGFSLPTLVTSVPLIRVYLTGTARTPVDSRARFHEVHVPGYDDGDGEWSLPVDPDKFSLWPDGAVAPINQTALEADAKRRVETVKREREMRGGGSALAQGISAARITPHGAHAESAIVIGSHGMATVFTRVVVGNVRRRVAGVADRNQRRSEEKRGDRGFAA